MKKVIINYLKSLGIDYFSGVKVREKAWQSNSSSEHTAILSQRKVKKILTLDEYPTLKDRIINNVLYIERTSTNEYDSKRGFYFSEDHYTVVDKINYALSLLIDSSRYNDSLYVVDYFKFSNQRELEESKRLLIKYYSGATKLLRKILITRFQLDDVVFSFDKVLKTLISIKTCDVDDIFIKLVHAGFVCLDDEDFYEDMKSYKRIDLNSIINIDTVDSDSFPDMCENILENEETLTDFVLSVYSEVYPVQEGCSDKIYQSMENNGLILNGKCEDTKISCKMLVRDFADDPEKLIPVELTESTSITGSVMDYAYELTYDVDDADTTVVNLNTGKTIDKWKLQADKYLNSPYVVFDPDFDCPVVRLNENRDSVKIANRTAVSGYGVAYLDDGSVLIHTSCSSSSVTTLNGDILINRIRIKFDNYDDLKKFAKELIKSVKPKYSIYDSIKEDEVDTLDKARVGEYVRRIVEDYFTDLSYIYDESFDFFDQMDLSNNNLFDKVEKDGITYYWITLSKILPTLEKTSDESIKTIANALGCFKSLFGEEKLDRIVFGIPVTVNIELNNI